jgi:Arc/MetJ-type ribon-helix-helix transcriptional regulator
MSAPELTKRSYRIPKPLVAKIDEVVETRGYGSESEFVRAAVREKLALEHKIDRGPYANRAQLILEAVRKETAGQEGAR